MNTCPHPVRFESTESQVIRVGLLNLDLPAHTGGSGRTQEIHVFRFPAFERHAARALLPSDIYVDALQTLGKRIAICELHPGDRPEVGEGNLPPRPDFPGSVRTGPQPCVSRRRRQGVSRASLIYVGTLRRRHLLVGDQARTYHVF